MEYLPGAQQMKEADRYTIETLGVSSLTLMEWAAAGCVRVMQEQELDLSSVCVVCGSGNNGGDGFAIARLLLKEGYPVSAVLAGNPDHCTPECRTQIERFEALGGVIRNELEEKEYSIIVDALFGVGLSREVRGNYRELIERLNACPAYKFAVDIPSGVSADTGCVLGAAFRADCTVTFQKQKLGLELYPGKTLAGEVIVEDIGISDARMREDRRVVRTPELSDYHALLPKRPADSHKGTFGKLLVIAGSVGMSGAACLNALAAYRAGAGLVRVYTAEANRVILQSFLPEAIITTCREFDREELLSLLSWADCVCLGSGIGTDETAVKITETVLACGSVPGVIDADGLNVTAAHGLLESAKHKNYVLTPHMKEMSRLCGRTVEEIRNGRMDVLAEFTETHGLTCVLKDARTLIADGQGAPVLNRSGNSAMAKAGAGDVLAGIIAGLLAQGLSCRDAAVLGAYIHGRAGDLAREAIGPYGVMARDLADYAAAAMAETERG